MKTRLLLAALALLAALGATAAAAPGERLAVVTLQAGGATVYSGDGLTQARGLRRVDRAELSPDGELLAYTRLVDGTTEIRLTRVTGGADQLVARVLPYDIALAFSPDGTQLTYSSAAGLSTTAVARIAPRRISLPRAWRDSRFNHLAYEPDGRRLLLSRTAGDGREGTLVNELVALELATGAGRTLLRSANPYDMRARPASFSPDGSVVAVDGTGGIALVPTRGGAPRFLSQRRPNGYDHSPLLSPDGSRIAFARSPYRGVSDVYTTNVDGRGLRRLTTTPIPPRGTPKVGTTPLAWSPDGSDLLVFRHDRLAVVDLETRTITNVRTTGIRYAIPTVRWVAG
jgi:Tol biopolymer transport system component